MGVDSISTFYFFFREWYFSFQKSFRGNEVLFCTFLWILLAIAFHAIRAIHTRKFGKILVKFHST